MSALVCPFAMHELVGRRLVSTDWSYDGGSSNLCLPRGRSCKRSAAAVPHGRTGATLSLLERHVVDAALLRRRRRRNVWRQRPSKMAGVRRSRRGKKLFDNLVCSSTHPSCTSENLRFKALYFFFHSWCALLYSATCAAARLFATFSSRADECTRVARALVWPRRVI